MQESVLRQEHVGGVNQYQYGRRVRDCHAEVLARRAFRRAVTLEIQRHLLDFQNRRRDEAPTTSSDGMMGSVNSNNILMATSLPSSADSGSVDEIRIRFALKESVTLHFYASSTPCGNATVSVG